MVSCSEQNGAAANKLNNFDSIRSLYLKFVIFIQKFTIRIRIQIFFLDSINIKIQTQNYNIQFDIHKYSIKYLYNTYKIHFHALFIL